MEEKSFICIICPIGCNIIVRGEDKAINSTVGNKCKRGETYASEEFLAPMRIFTSSVKVSGGISPLVPVRSRSPIPKKLLFRCVEQLRSLELKAPVLLYDIAVPDILGTGVDIVTTTAVIEDEVFRKNKD